MKLLAMDPCTEEELKLLKPLKKGSFQVHYQFYIPVLYTTWNVENKNIFGQTLRSRVTVGEDFIKGKFGFADGSPDSQAKEINDRDILLFPPENLDKQLNNAYEFIRKYYIHQKRSWSVPIIALHDKQIVYHPYSLFLKNDSIDSKKDLLLEHYSMDIDFLINHRPLRELLISNEKEGVNR